MSTATRSTDLDVNENRRTSATKISPSHAKYAKEQEKAREYMELHHIPRLITQMVNQILFTRSPNPKLEFILFLAERINPEELRAAGFHFDVQKQKDTEDPETPTKEHPPGQEDTPARASDEPARKVPPPEKESGVTQMEPSKEEGDIPKEPDALAKEGEEGVADAVVGEAEALGESPILTTEEGGAVPSEDKTEPVSPAGAEPGAEPTSPPHAGEVSQEDAAGSPDISAMPGIPETEPHEALGGGMNEDGAAAAVSPEAAEKAAAIETAPERHESETAPEREEGTEETGEGEKNGLNRELLNPEFIDVVASTPHEEEKKPDKTDDPLENSEILNSIDQGPVDESKDPNANSTSTPAAPKKEDYGDKESPNDTEKSPENKKKWWDIPWIELHTGDDAEDDERVVEVLKTMACDWGESDEEGDNVLIYLCKLRQVTSGVWVDWLLDGRCDPEHTNNEGKTYLTLFE